MSERDDGSRPSKRPLRVVFVVCHPDDEAIWVGGLLHALSKFDFLRTFVTCLSGGDPSSPRAAEFAAARKVAGYTDGVLVGDELPPPRVPLPRLAERLEDGLTRLGIAREDISLLVTHSPYGDEHAHPHHRQTYRELRDWSRRASVPFGYFSVVQVPFFSHEPLLRNAKRHGSLHLLAYARCRPMLSPIERIADPNIRNYLECPAYYLQFLTDADAKKKMLTCYESINLDAHFDGYTAATNPCESLYIFDDRGLEPFAVLMSAMSAPGVPDLFSFVRPLRPRRVVRALVRLVRGSEKVI